MVDCGSVFYLLYLHISYIYFISFIFILFYTYTKQYILTHGEVEGLPLLEKQSFKVHVFLKELHDGHNRPQLVAHSLNKEI
jgi:hypothetical protein